MRPLARTLRATGPRRAATVSGSAAPRVAPSSRRGYFSGLRRDATAATGTPKRRQPLVAAAPPRIQTRQHSDWDSGIDLAARPARPAGVDAGAGPRASYATRIATAADKPRIAEFFSQLDEKSWRQRFGGEKAEMQDRVIPTMLEIPSVLAFEGDRIVGVCNLDHEQGRTEAQVSVVLDRSARGKQVPKLLLSEAETLARSRGAARLTAYAAEENMPVFHLLRKSGFDPTPMGHGAIQYEKSLVAPISPAMSPAGVDAGAVPQASYATRIATAADKPSIAEFFSQLDEKSWQQRFGGKKADMQGTVIPMLLENQCVLAFDGDRVVGVCDVGRKTGSTEAEISVVLAPSARGKRVPSLFIPEAEGLARSLGATKLVAYTAASNTSLGIILHWAGFNDTYMGHGQVKYEKSLVQGEPAGQSGRPT